MNFKIELYNTDGDTTKDYFSIILCAIYLCFLGLWVSICFKNQAYVRKIHILMGALLVVVTIDLIVGAADKRCVKVISTTDGHNLVFYAIKFTRVVFFYTVIALMFSGWSLMRPFLPVKEKMVLVIVIVFEVVIILIREINPFRIKIETWNEWYYMVDTICAFSVVIPYMGMCEWLEEVYKAARNFEKIKEDGVGFTLSVYGYFCVWRFVVSTVTNIPDPFYSYMMEEIFSLVFCMVIFYVYRPAHCLIEGPKMDKNKQPGQVSFSYQELPEDFEW